MLRGSPSSAAVPSWPWKRPSSTSRAPAESAHAGGPGLITRTIPPGSVSVTARVRVAAGAPPHEASKATPGERMVWRKRWELRPEARTDRQLDGRAVERVTGVATSSYGFGGSLRARGE